MVAVMLTTATPVRRLRMRAYDFPLNRSFHCPSWSMYPLAHFHHCITIFENLSYGLPLPPWLVLPLLHLRASPQARFRVSSSMASLASPLGSFVSSFAPFVPHVHRRPISL